MVQLTKVQQLINSFWKHTQEISVYPALSLFRDFRHFLKEGNAPNATSIYSCLEIALQDTYLSFTQQHDQHMINGSQFSTFFELKMVLLEESYPIPRLMKKCSER